MNLVENVQVVALVITRPVCVVVIQDFMAMHAVSNQWYFETFFLFVFSNILGKEILTAYFAVSWNSRQL